MAKAKKESKGKSESKPAATGKSATPAAPTIDTTHAASAAAAVVASGMNAPAQAAGAKDSTSFKNLKDSLNKPHNTLGNALDKSGLKGGKHSHLPFGHAAGKQIGRNQTFGADVNRSGVPRRTGG